MSVLTWEWSVEERNDKGKKVHRNTWFAGRYECEDGTELDKFLATAGEDGWEIVGADNYTLFFKRPKP